jgi:predicted Mrr-cat superfamily restriction endonuclease
MEQQQQAFVLRIAPSEVDRVDEALASNQIIIGWSEAAALLDPHLDWHTFREVMRTQYYAQEPNLRRAGAAAGHMWRFMREMNPGDLVVVPHGSEFYVAKVEGPATHDPSKIAEDTAFRRTVAWQNDKQPIPRSLARAALQSRMKTQGTCAYATDILPEILDCLEVAGREQPPTFHSDLHQRLVREALSEIRSGRLDSYGFEYLIKKLLEQKGAENVRIVARAEDKGADLLATFRIAGAFTFLVAVQAKQYYRPEPPVGPEAVQQLIQGIEAESANLGMLVTAGSVSKEAAQLAEKYFDEKGTKIELVDGPQLAALIVEIGLSPT